MTNEQNAVLQSLRRLAISFLIGMCLASCVVGAFAATMLAEWNTTGIRSRLLSATDEASLRHVALGVAGLVDSGRDVHLACVVVALLLAGASIAQNGYVIILVRRLRKQQ